MASDPSPAERRDHWNAAYTRNPPDRVSWFEAEPTTSLDLVETCALAPDSPIIDIGGGASRLSGALYARGYRDLSILDIARTALDEAARSLPATVTMIEADITAWQPQKHYALWHDRAVFHFLTDPQDRASYLATLRRAVMPHGHVILATFAPDGPERCSGLPVVRYDADRMAELLAPDFTLIARRAHTHNTPGGAAQRFIYAHLQRTGPG
ncbi:MAG: class I SAM-dependent methyltransferase [Acidiphilium sp.]|jgi:trans-aconitate methyltransferase|nr:class I SAM-dependent methyltransferase [Acidiphilium sp.]